MKFDKSKKELVYYTTNYKDNKLVALANYCSIMNYRLVLILPTTKKYSYEVNECLSILNNDLLIYEISMGMKTVLASRARKYVEYIDTAVLVDEYNGEIPELK